MKRHLVVSYHTCPLEEPGHGLAGGMNIYLRGLLPALAARGWQLDVITRGAQDERLTMAQGASGSDVKPRVQVIRIGCGAGTWDRQHARETVPEFCARARERLDLSQYASVSSHYWLSGMVTQEICPDLPQILMFHTIQGAKGEPESEAARERAHYEEMLATKARAVVCNSWMDVRTCATYLPQAREKLCSIRPGLSPYFGAQCRLVSRDRLGHQIYGKLLVMAARQDPIKRIDLALEAIRQLRSEGLDISILVVGQQLDQEPGVFSMPSVEHRQMPWILSAADLVLCPSDYESFGLVALEALSAGVPVIVGPGGYWSRLFPSIGAGCVASTDEWVTTLRRLLKQPLERTRMGVLGAKLSTKFTWERAAMRWERLLV